MLGNPEYNQWCREGYCSLECFEGPPRPRARAVVGRDSCLVQMVGPVGIGGWLIIPAIGLPLSVLLNAFALTKEGVLVLSRLLQGQGIGLTAAESFGLVCTLIQLVLVSIASSLFFAARASAPTAFIISMVASLLLHSVDIMLTLAWIGLFDWRVLPPWGCAYAVVTLWIVYFRKSKRVRNTFVR